MTSRRPLTIVAGQLRQLPAGDTIDAALMIPHGTSFPPSPATNDWYARDDLGALCQYDGTRWLSTSQIITPFTMRSGPPYTSNGGIFYIRLNCIIDNIYLSIYVASTNNASNYWTINVKSGSTTFYTKNTAAMSAGIEYSIEENVSYVISGQCFVELIKNGSPGGISPYALFDIRRIREE